MEEEPIITFCIGCDTQITDNEYVCFDSGEPICQECAESVEYEIEEECDGPTDSQTETEIEMTDMADALNEIS